MIRLVRQAGALAFVGDSPGIGDLRKVADRAGILAVIEEEGATLVAFDDVVVLKGRGRFQRFEVARAASETDAIINLPKLKTHGMTVLTGAVKNLFGCIPGKRKVQWHFNTGVDHASFTCMLVELSQALKPCLTVMDAVVGMEGNGPGSGDPRKIGVVLAGPDPVAVDVVSGNIVGLAPEELPVVRAAAKADPLRLVADGDLAGFAVAAPGALGRDGTERHSQHQEGRQDGDSDASSHADPRSLRIPSGPACRRRQIRTGAYAAQVRPGDR